LSNPGNNSAEERFIAANPSFRLLRAVAVFGQRNQNDKARFAQRSGYSITGNGSISSWPLV
jgi:hypothetical protein